MTDISPTGGQRSDSIRPVLASLRELADSYFRQGRLADSRVVLRAVSQLLALDDIGREEQLSFLLQTATILVAAYFCTNRDDDQMLSAIEQARSLSEEMLNTRSLADSLSLLSQARYFTAVNAASSLSSTDADYGDVLASQQQALCLRESLGDSRGIAESLFYIGLVHERQQQYDLAQDYYLRVRSIAETHGHRFEGCEAARHLGGIAWYRGNLNLALARAKEALALREEINFQLYLPFDHLLLAQVYLAMEDLTHAWLHYQEAEALASKLELRQAELYALLGLGDVLERQGQLAHAAASYEHALALAQELQIKRAIGRAAECLQRCRGTQAHAQRPELA